MKKRVCTPKRVYFFSLLVACLTVLAGPALSGVLTVTDVSISYGNSTIGNLPSSSVSFSGYGTHSNVQYSGTIEAPSDALLILSQFSYYCASTTACGDNPTMYFEAHGSGYGPGAQFSLALNGYAGGAASGSFWAWVIHGDPESQHSETQLGRIDFALPGAGPFSFGPTAPVSVDLSTAPAGEFDLRVWFNIYDLAPDAVISWGAASADILINQNTPGAAVPEPAAALMVGTALAGFLCWRLRRRV